MDADDQKTVGVVGLGAMGAPIVGHLAKAGRPTSVYDRNVDKMSSMSEEFGVRAATAPADLAADCEVVLVLVDNDAAVLEVVDALVADIGRLRVILVCSSVLPQTIRAAAERAEAHGVAVLDAAMIGGIRGVEAGTLTLLVGGDASVLDAVRDAVAPWTSTVHHLGPLGAGQIAKSANNLIHWAQVCAIEEAFRIVERAGLSVPAVRSALCDGPADSRALRELEQMRLTWWKKDLDGSRVLAAELGTAHTVGDLCTDVMPTITVDSLAALLVAGGDDDV